MTWTFPRFVDRFRWRVQRVVWRPVLGVSLAASLGNQARADLYVAGLGQTPDTEVVRRSFATSFGLDAERRALELGGPARSRALKRLQTLANQLPEQVAELLDQWLATEPRLSPVETWTVLRPMARLAGQPRMRARLAEVLAGEALSVEASDPYAPLIPEVAALALARESSTESAILLAEWLRRPSDRANLVARALLAHRPTNISPLLEANGPTTPLLLETLGELGDPAAIPYLRGVVKRATADVQAAAAIALAKLGVRETQDLATMWLARSDTPRELVAASAYILKRFQHPDRVQAFGRLTNMDAELALALAEQVPPDDAFLLLDEHVSELGTLAQRERVVAVFRRVGKSAASRLLELVEKRQELRWAAARAFGDVGSVDDLARLEPLLAKPETRAAALSAMIVIAVRHPRHDRAALLAKLEAASRSGLPAVRTIGRTGMALLDEKVARRYLNGTDPSELVAAATAASLFGDRYARVCVRRLERLSGVDLASNVQLSAPVLALSSVLSFVSPRESISGRLLRALASSKYPVAATARWQLWARGADAAGTLARETDETLDELLAARQSSAFLGETSKPALALLDALTTEADPGRRAALVRAVAGFATSRSVAESLAWVAAYDPDAGVRMLAGGKVTDESSLHATWIEAPASTKEDVGYWVNLDAPGRLPASLYFAHGQNALVFIRGPAKADVAQSSSPLHEPARVRFAPVASNETVSFRQKTLLHSIHNSQ